MAKSFDELYSQVKDSEVFSDLFEGREDFYRYLNENENADQYVEDVFGVSNASQLVKKKDGSDSLLNSPGDGEPIKLYEKKKKPKVPEHLDWVSEEQKKQWVEGNTPQNLAPDAQKYSKEEPDPVDELSEEEKIRYQMEQERNARMGSDIALRGLPPQQLEQAQKRRELNIKGQEATLTQGFVYDNMGRRVAASESRLEEADPVIANLTSDFTELLYLNEKIREGRLYGESDAETTKKRQRDLNSKIINALGDNVISEIESRFVDNYDDPGRSIEGIKKGKEGLYLRRERDQFIDIDRGYVDGMIDDYFIGKKPGEKGYIPDTEKGNEIRRQLRGTLGGYFRSKYLAQAEQKIVDEMVGDFEFSDKKIKEEITGGIQKIDAHYLSAAEAFKNNIQTDLTKRFEDQKKSLLDKQNALISQFQGEESDFQRSLGEYNQKASDLNARRGELKPERFGSTEEYQAAVNQFNAEIQSLQALGENLQAQERRYELANDEYNQEVQDFMISFTEANVEAQGQYEEFVAKAKKDRQKAFEEYRTELSSKIKTEGETYLQKREQALKKYYELQKDANADVNFVKQLADNLQSSLASIVSAGLDYSGVKDLDIKFVNDMINDISTIGVSNRYMGRGFTESLKEGRFSEAFNSFVSQLTDQVPTLVAGGVIQGVTGNPYLTSASLMYLDMAREASTAKQDILDRGGSQSEVDAAVANITRAHFAMAPLYFAQGSLLFGGKGVQIGSTSYYKNFFKGFAQEYPIEGMQEIIQEYTSAKNTGALVVYDKQMVTDELTGEQKEIRVPREKTFREWFAKDGVNVLGEIAPTVLAFGSVQANTETKMARAIERDYANVSKLLGEKQRLDFVNDMFTTMGENGVMMLPDVLFFNKEITKEEHAALKEQMPNYLAKVKETQEAGTMSRDNARFYLGQTMERDRYEAEVKNATNETDKKRAQKKLDNVNKVLEDVATGKDVSYTKIRFANGLTSVLTNDEALNYLESLGNPFAKALTNETRNSKGEAVAIATLETENEKVNQKLNELFEKKQKRDEFQGVEGIDINFESKIDFNDDANVSAIAADLGMNEDAVAYRFQEARAQQARLNNEVAGVEIVMLNDKDYKAAMKKVGGNANSRGNFTYQFDENTQKYKSQIQINIEKSNSRTIGHETAHALMLQKFGENLLAYEDFQKGLAKVMKATDIIQLTDFASNYQAFERHDEFMAEFAGRMAAAYNEAENLDGKQQALQKTKLQRIAQYISEFVSNMTNGRIKPFRDLANVDEAIDFFNSFSNSLNKNAVQEQTAGQVPVQQETQVGQEVAQGETQAEPQGVTQEGEVEQQTQEEIEEEPLTTEDVEGREIEQGYELMDEVVTIDVEKGKVDRGPQSKAQVNRDFEIAENDYVDVDAIDGRNAIGFLGDTQVAGTVQSPDGTQLKADGGPNFVKYANRNLQVDKDGYYKGRAAVWASTFEDSTSKLMNKFAKAELALIGAQQKTGVLGNRRMLLHFGELMNAAVARGIDEQEILKEVNSKLETTYKKDKDSGAKVSLRDELGGVENFASIDEFIDYLDPFLSKDDFKSKHGKEKLKDTPITYEVRNNIFAKIFNVTNHEKFGFPSIVAGKKYTYDKTILDYANDEMFTDAGYGDFVGYVEYDPETLRLEKVDENSDFYNPSYPYVITAEKVRNKFFNNFIDGRAIFYDTKPTSLKANQTPFGLRKKPQAARAIMGAMPKTKVESEKVKARAKELKSKPQKVVKVYHGGTMDLPGDNFYVASDRAQAEYYARQNQGEVIESFIDVNKLAPEELVKDMITEKGLFPEDYQRDELMIPELLDQRFDETALSKENADAITQELKDIGYLGISFLDQDILQERKGGVENYFIFNPDTLAKTEEEVGGMEANGFQSKSQLTEPSSDAWTTSLTQAQVDEIVGGDFGATLDEKVKEGKKHNTQIATTVNTYNKWNEWLGENVPNFKDAKVLDVGAGLGHVHKAFKNKKENIQSYEPFYDKVQYEKYSGKKAPDFSALDASDVPTSQYDVVVNNAVLNVVPADIRESIVNTIGAAIKPGGIGIINVMKQDYLNSLIKKIDAGTSKNIKLSDTEVFVRESGKNTYQKGWKATELQSYVQDVLGPDFSVEIAPRAITSGPTILIRKGQEMGSKAQIDELVSQSKKMKVPQRYKGDVGKFIGGDLYVHKSAMDVLPQTEMKKAESKLPADFNYEVVKYNSKTKAFSFIASPDWDTNPEPVVGDAYKVSAEGNVSVTKQKADPQIYHHKWNFVRDDYAGFDVAESIQRSIDWFGSVKPKVNMFKIGTQSYWQNEALPNLESKAQMDEETATESDFKLPFGKHKGKWFTTTPPAYRQWLLTQPWFDVDKYLKPKPKYESKSQVDYQQAQEDYQNDIKNGLSQKDAYVNMMENGLRAFDIKQALPNANIDSKALSDALEEVATAAMQELSNVIDTNVEKINSDLAAMAANNMTIEEMANELSANGYRDLEISIAMIDSAFATPEEIIDALGTDYNQTIQNILDNQEMFDVDFIENIKNRNSSVKRAQSAVDLRNAFIESGMNFTDAGTMVDYLVEQLGDSMPAIQMLRDQLENLLNDPNKVETDLESFRQIASRAGRILNMARGLMKKDLNLTIEKSLERQGIILTEKQKETLKRLTTDVAAATERVDAARAELEQGNISDDYFKEYQDAQKALGEANIFLADFLNKRLPTFWNERISSLGSRALLNLSTVMLSAVSNVENALVSSGLPTKAIIGMRDAFGKGIKGNTLSIQNYKLAFSLSRKDSWTDMTLLAKYGNLNTGLEKNLEAIGTINAFNDAKLTRNALLAFIKKATGKENIETEEEWVDALDATLTKNAKGEVVVRDGKSYTIARSMFWALNPGSYVSEGIGRAMAFGGDIAFGKASATRGLIDYLNNIDDTQVEGSLFQNLLKDKKGNMDKDTIRAIQSLMTQYTELGREFEQLGLSRVFMQDNFVSSGIGKGRQSIKSSVSRLYADIQRGKVDNKFLAQIKKQGLQILDVLLWTLMPFTKVPVNFIGSAMMKINIPAAGLKYLTSEISYQGKYKKFKKDFPKGKKLEGRNAKLEFEKRRVELFKAKRQAGYDFAQIASAGFYQFVGTTAAYVGAYMKGEDEEERETFERLNLKGDHYNASLHVDFLTELYKTGNFERAKANLIKQRGINLWKENDIVSRSGNLGFLGYSVGVYGNIKKAKSAQDNFAMMDLFAEESWYGALYFGQMTSTGVQNIPMLQGFSRVANVFQDIEKGTTKKKATENFLASTAATTLAPFFPSFGSFVSKGDGDNIQSPNDIFPGAQEEITANSFLNKVTMRIARNIPLSKEKKQEYLPFYKSKLSAYGQELGYKSTAADDGTPLSYIQAALDPFNIRPLRPQKVEVKPIPKALGIKEDPRVTKHNYFDSEIQKNNIIEVEKLSKMFMLYEELTGRPYKMSVEGKEVDMNTYLAHAMKNKKTFDGGSNIPLDADKGKPQNFSYQLPEDLFRREIIIRGKYLAKAVGSQIQFIDKIEADLNTFLKNDEKEEAIKKIENVLEGHNEILNQAEASYEADYVKNRERQYLKYMYSKGLFREEQIKQLGNVGLVDDQGKFLR